MYAWIITQDKLSDKTQPEGTNANAKGIVGPRNPDAALVAQLQKGAGTPFRMYDDDGAHYYTGRIVGRFDGLEPLYDFGLPNAGATELRMRDTSGTWRTV